VRRLGGVHKHPLPSNAVHACVFLKSASRLQNGRPAEVAAGLLESEAGWTALVILECETRDPQRLAALAASIK